MVQLRGRLYGRDDPVQPGRETERQRGGNVLQRGGGAAGDGEAQAEHAEQIHRAVLRGGHVNPGYIIVRVDVVSCVVPKYY